MINPLPWLLGQDSDEKELGLIQFVPLVFHYISYLKSEFTTLLPTLPYPYDHKTQQAVDQANEILNKYKDAQHADAQHAKDWSFAFFPRARRTGSQIALLAIETPGATRGHRGKWIMS